MRADYPALSCESCDNDREAGEPEPECERCPLGRDPVSEENKRIVDMVDIVSGSGMQLDADLLGAWLGPMTRQRLQVTVMKAAMIRAMKGEADGGH